MGNFWGENGDLYKFSTFRRGYAGHDLLSKCKYFCEIAHQEVCVITTFQSEMIVRCLFNPFMGVVQERI
jgi:hypothetical protein